MRLIILLTILSISVLLLASSLPVDGGSSNSAILEPNDLQASILSGNLEGVKRILSSDLTLLAKTKDNLGFTCLHVACVSSSTQILDYLIGLDRAVMSGDLLNKPNAEGWMPIHMAVAFNQTKQVERLLLEPNITPSLNAISGDGHSILHLAVLTGNTELLETILEDPRLDTDSLLAPRDRQSFTEIDENNATPLELAILLNNSKMVDLLE